MTTNNSCQFLSLTSSCIKQFKTIWKLKEKYLLGKNESILQAKDSRKGLDHLGSVSVSVLLFLPLANNDEVPQREIERGRERKIARIRYKRQTNRWTRGQTGYTCSVSKRGDFKKWNDIIPKTWTENIIERVSRKGKHVPYNGMAMECPANWQGDLILTHK